MWASLNINKGTFFCLYLMLLFVVFTETFLTISLSITTFTCVFLCHHIPSVSHSLLASIHYRRFKIQPRHECLFFTMEGKKLVRTWREHADFAQGCSYWVSWRGNLGELTTLPICRIYIYLIESILQNAALPTFMLNHPYNYFGEWQCTKVTCP